MFTTTLFPTLLVHSARRVRVHRNAARPVASNRRNSIVGRPANIEAALYPLLLLAAVRG